MLGGGFACKGVMPCRVKLCQWPEDEVAHVHAWVRQCQARVVNDPVVYGNKVDVDGAVDISSLRVAVWRRVYAALHFLYNHEHIKGKSLSGRFVFRDVALVRYVMWDFCCSEHHSDVEERIGRLESPRCSLDDVGAFYLHVGEGR